MVGDTTTEIGYGGHVLRLLDVVFECVDFVLKFCIVHF